MKSQCWIVPIKDYGKHGWAVTKCPEFGIVVIPFPLDYKDWDSIVRKDYPMGWASRLEHEYLVMENGT